VNWVLDADIRGVFDNLSHEWGINWSSTAWRIRGYFA
jgi:hypothetical protein